MMNFQCLDCNHVFVPARDWYRFVAWPTCPKCMRTGHGRITVLYETHVMVETHEGVRLVEKKNMQNSSGSR